MKMIDVFKDQFNRELNRKAGVNAEVNFLVGWCSAFIGFIVYLISVFSSDTPIISIFFIGGVSAIITLCLVSLFYVIKAYTDWFKGVKYQDFQTPEVINNYLSDLTKYHEENNYSLNKREDEIAKYIMDIYSKSVTNLIHVNDSKYESLFKAKKALLIALILFLVPVTIVSIDLITKGSQNSEKKTPLEIQNKIVIGTIDSVVVEKDTVYLDVTQ